ncbi:copper-binding protein [Pelistega sp. NLN82]|uniref:Copper-binding protein n=1 Tax=Pelistega ratti TaxID=2652177 RepID=A0A6L9Y7Z4_9BURK|nr:copper-binding protein [Pelistega ratti]NEN76620.1 copper-binding protein [Pelistega ratti]
MKKYTKVLSFATMVMVGAIAFAQEQGSATGEVRRIDAQKGKIAIKHGPIADLKLSAMTLVYDIDKKLLVPIKAGDKVKFTATHKDNRYIIDEIEVNN